MSPSPLKAKWTAVVKTPKKAARSNAPDSVSRDPRAPDSDPPANVDPKSPAPDDVDDREDAGRQEIEVLQAIFMDDFEEHHATKSAWGTTEHSFRIRLKADTNEDISLIFSGKLPSTYPKSLPSLQVDSLTGLRQDAITRARTVLDVKPRELLGGVMIHEIATMLQEILDQDADAQAQRSVVPSLEQERATTEAAAAKAAQLRELEAQRQLEARKAEEEVAMQRMVEDEMRRREEARKRRTLNSSDSIDDYPAGMGDSLVFDRPVHVATPDATDLVFKSVSILARIGGGSCTNVLAAYPNVRTTSPLCLVLKRITIAKNKLKKSILELEQELEKAKKVHHENLINVIDFKIAYEDNQWHVDVLTDHSTGGTIRDLLAVVETLPAKRVRSFAVDILTALDFLHKNGIVHGRLHCGNIFLVPREDDMQVIMVADASFQDHLHALVAESQSFLPNATEWSAPELTGSGLESKSRKSDVWDFGTCLIQMLFGLGTPKQCQSVQSFMNGAELSEPLEELVRAIMRVDPKRRPNAFDIIPYEFLRTDAPVLRDSISPRQPSTFSTASSNNHPHRISRHESSHLGASNSRYQHEWDEAGRLGRGGYGEVVKARNKLDGRLYAIKKITQKTASELNQVLSEVYLLGTLNHPYVVRYYTAWSEEDFDLSEETDDDFTSSTDVAGHSDDSAPSFSLNQSSVGLDFISSSGYPRIEFGDDSDDDPDNEDSDEESDDTGSDSGTESGPPRTKSHDTSITESNIQRTRSGQRPMRSTLYIQMEFCERLTLRDMIRKNIHEDSEEVWRLLRQMLEGLVHIHNHGIIHRDLKPENVFIDSSNNPKIGDFGLATTGQYYIADTLGSSERAGGGGDMTRSVGTTLYVAPELKSSGSGHYTDKVDMYSLGVIFFEMCYPLHTAMERTQMLTSIRHKEHRLPDEFGVGEKKTQGDIILSLIKHRPNERPSSAELLRSGKLPVQIQDEAVKVALQGLSDVNSPHFQKMMNTLFAQNSTSNIKDHMWDLGGDSAATQSANDWMILQSLVRDTVVSCFRRHGAIETKRQALLPLSDHYANLRVVRLLDPSGVIVQLPYDLTLPHARAVARQLSGAGKTYALGTVFRADEKGGAPLSSREADFDIISQDNRNRALEEAEVIKVMDEILDELPSFKKTAMAFHVNHSGLLDIILDFCRVAPQQRNSVKDILSRLNTQGFTFAKLRTELRAPPASVSSTSLDELAVFDFRDTIEKTYSRLLHLLKESPHKSEIKDLCRQVNSLAVSMKDLKVRRPLYWSPLSCFNDKFYRDAIMFQCLYDGKKRDVLAAGGRYDMLIDDLHLKLSSTAPQQPMRGVGISVAWNRLISSMSRYIKQSGTAYLKKGQQMPPIPSHWVPRRCDVLVASFDVAVLRTAGMRILADLWAEDISAELAAESLSTEQLLNRYKDDRHSWILIIKHDETVSGKPDLKVKNMDQKEDADVHSSNLLAYMRGAVRERDARETTHERATARLLRHSSQPEQSLHADRKAPVQVLLANHKSKKGNKFRVIENAQTRAAETADGFKHGPIASIETSDQVLDMIRETRLSDAESWRKVIHSVPLAEREYLGEVRDLLEGYRAQYGGSGWIFNFRSGKCIYYDLML